MSQPSGSGTPPAPKAVPSLTKRPSAVTRGGSQKLKFVPTLPARRKKEDVKPEPKDVSLEAKPSFRGRGRGGPSDRGRGPKPPMEMTASGPFAMGPALAGNTSTARRAAPRSNFSVPIPSSSPFKLDLGAGLSAINAPSVGTQDKGKSKATNEEEDYSDPDEGVKIVDMQHVRDLDWMAPESLVKEQERGQVKKEQVSAAASGDVDLNNAIDLSESEEEEQMEDIIDDFEMKADLDDDSTLRQDRLYFFQFPYPFPTFETPPPTEAEVKDEVSSPSKKVTFAPDAKSDPSEGSKPVDLTKDDEPAAPSSKLDGIIGQLEIYRSGVVKMRLKNGILLDVNAATQPSFLQQATYIDAEKKQLVVLGEVNKQFVLSPDIDTLLEAMETSEKEPKTLVEGEEELISMDVTK